MSFKDRHPLHSNSGLNKRRIELGPRGHGTLVTGESQGLGYGCAYRLTKAGYKIVVCVGHEQSLQRASVAITSATHVDAFPRKTDLIRAEEIRVKTVPTAVTGSISRDQHRSHFLWFLGHDSKLRYSNIILDIHEKARKT